MLLSKSLKIEFESMADAKECVDAFHAGKSMSIMINDQIAMFDLIDMTIKRFNVNGRVIFTAENLGESNDKQN